MSSSEPHEAASAQAQEQATTYSQTMNHYTEPTIEAGDVGDDGEDSFSDYGGSIASETQSITSSLANSYFEIQGRRYHTYFGPDKNPLPSDSTEQQRLDLVHEALYLASKMRHFHAPVGNNPAIQNVLDLGTGSGIWAIDFADENPHAQVIGLDLTPTQPNWVPPNCRFEVDDFELDWTFLQKFDFIHARTLSQSVKDWPKLLKQAKRHMNPGGWIELSDAHFQLRSDDNSIPHTGYAPKEAWDLMDECLQATGCINPTASRFRTLLIAAGFTRVQTKIVKVPVSPWPKDKNLKQCGWLQSESLKSGYQAYLLVLGTRALGKSEEEMLKLCQEAYSAHYDPKWNKVHAYFNLQIAFAQKPFAES